MAKHVIIEAYTFTPATKTIVVTGKNIRREQLLLITNVTAGTVIYNFSDPSLGFTSYTNAVDAVTGQETTTIVLAYATAAMNAADKISILVEESYQEIIPSEVMRDPVDKLRVSTPQSLIDTDFEYGVQPTKWEMLNTMNGRSTAFYDPTVPLTITNMSVATKLVTVNCTTPPAVGTPIFIFGTQDTANVDGWWVVESVVAGTSFSFTVTNTPAATLYDATKTYCYAASFYTGAAIPVSTVAGAAITLSGTVATVTTTNTHGLQVGNGIYVVGTSGATGLLNSSWVVATTPTSNTFTFACTATGTITALATSVVPRPLGYVEHRPFDGGVQFSNVTPYQGYQVVRQTRRYFRYQSGKGVQFSTGSILKPPFQVDNITSSGTTVTVTSRYPHGLMTGAVVRVSGCDQAAYNGTFTVTGVSGLTFTYTALSAPGVTPATGNWVVGPFSWYGASNRVGMFDLQNGFYFEYDGQTLYAVRRSSTFQCAGYVATTNGSNTITGTGTKFSSQLKPGDWIVIRGMSYIVQAIPSDTQMHIYPEYRGTSAVRCIVSKTINTKYPQSSWNIDKCDGTGASLFNVDLTKMQMFYADYTWYGAGAIRFGFKNSRGEVVYAHRIPNNNVNTEAYMRSGNLPARYETNTIPPYTYITATLAAATGAGGTIAVADASTWPAAGTVILTQAANTGAQIEYVTYTSRTNTTLTIGARAQTGGAVSAQTFTYSATAPIQAELYAPQCASTVSHWGSSIIMDGRYDDDKSFLFNYGMNLPSTFATAGTRYPVFSVRLAPTVDNGLTGLLGAREIINRMQLTPASCGVYTTAAGVKVELILNGRVSTGTFAPVGGSSLAQYANHGTTATIAGGEVIYTFFVAANNTNSQDLTKVRDIGNSILGGGTSLTVPNTTANIYPDGPDILTVCVTPLVANAAVAARLNWTEAQA